MGTLKPDTKYIYERVDDTVYAREIGTDPKDRFIVGQSLKDQQHIEREWREIFEEAKSNFLLKEELDRVKTTYYLSKKHESR